MSSPADPGRVSRNEFRQLCEAIEEEKRNKSLILIVVCHARTSVQFLEDNYKSSFLKRSNKRIIPTTAHKLSKAISWARELAGRKQKLMLLVSPYVTGISFDIPPKFHMVTVNRCGNIRRDGKVDKAKDHLLMDVSSTFCGVELRKWEGRPEKFRSRRFCILGEVYLCLDLDHPDINLDKPNLSKDEKARLAYTMTSLDPSVTDESSFWDKWKGVIACLLGATAGVMKFQAGMRVTGAGFYCSHWLGVKLFGGYLSTSAYMTAAVPAVGFAFGAAAAIYFIPWEKLWAWFQGVVGKLWDTLSRIWEWAKDKLSSLTRVVEDLPPPPYSMNAYYA